MTSRNDPPIYTFISFSSSSSSPSSPYISSTDFGGGLLRGGMVPHSVQPAGFSLSQLHPNVSVPAGRLRQNQQSTQTCPGRHSPARVELVTPYSSFWRFIPRCFLLISSNTSHVKVVDPLLCWLRLSAIDHFACTTRAFVCRVRAFALVGSPCFARGFRHET